MTSASLLELLSGRKPRAGGPLLAPLGQILPCFSRSFWPPGLAPRPVRADEDDLPVIASSGVARWSLGGMEGWTTRRELEEGFERAHERPGATRSTILPSPLTGSGPRLLLRDDSFAFRAVLTSLPLYPQRAWVGQMHGSLPPELLPALAALFNSGLIGAIYVHLHGGQSPGRDIRKRRLAAVPVPVAGYSQVSLGRLAHLSVRMHLLCLAPDELRPRQWDARWSQPLRHAIASECGRLYGLSEADAGRVVRGILAPRWPAGDRPRFRAREPLHSGPLLGDRERDELERLEEQERVGWLLDDDRPRLLRLKRARAVELALAETRESAVEVPASLQLAALEEERAATGGEAAGPRS